MKRIISFLLEMAFCLTMCACTSSSSSVVDRDLNKDNIFYSTLKYIEGKKLDDVLAYFNREYKNCYPSDMDTTYWIDKKFSQAGAVEEVDISKKTSNDFLKYDDVEYDEIHFYVDSDKNIVGVVLYPKLSLRVATDLESIIEKAGIEPRKKDYSFKEEKIYEIGNIIIEYTDFKSGGEERSLYYIYT